MKRTAQFRLTRGTSSDKSPRVTFSDELEYVVDGQPTPVRAEVDPQLVNCRAGNLGERGDGDDPRPRSILAGAALPQRLGSSAAFDRHERAGQVPVPLAIEYLPLVEHPDTLGVEHEKQLHMDITTGPPITPPPMQAIARVSDKSRAYLNSHHRHSAPEYGYEPACFVQGRTGDLRSKHDHYARQSIAHSMDGGSLRGKGRSSPLRVVRFEETLRVYPPPSSHTQASPKKYQDTPRPRSSAPLPAESPSRPSLVATYRRHVLGPPAEKAGKSESTFIDLMRTKVHRMRAYDNALDVGASPETAALVAVTTTGVPPKDKIQQKVEILQAREAAKREAERREREASCSRGYRHGREPASYERYSPPEVERRRATSYSRPSHHLVHTRSAPGTGSPACYPVPVPETPSRRAGDLPAPQRPGQFFRAGRQYSSHI